jgi:hypothetical protein
MAGHQGRNLSVRCAVSRSERATCERSQRGTPTAANSATSITVMLPSWLSRIMRGHHDKTLHRPLLSSCLPPRRNSLQLREGVMRQLCDHCGGRFGIGDAPWGNKFCKRTCKHAYLRELALDRDKIRCWYGFPSRGDRFKLLSPHAHTVPCKTSLSARLCSELRFRRPPSGGPPALGRARRARSCSPGEGAFRTQFDNNSGKRRRASLARSAYQSQTVRRSFL